MTINLINMDSLYLTGRGETGVTGLSVYITINQAAEVLGTCHLKLLKHDEQ